MKTFIQTKNQQKTERDEEETTGTRHVRVLIPELCYQDPNMHIARCRPGQSYRSSDEEVVDVMGYVRVSSSEP